MERDVARLLHDHAAALETYLRQRLREAAGFTRIPPRLAEAIDYSLLAGGKRLRPALVLESAAACHEGAAAETLDPLPAAAAVELIHTFSLVHDDLPAMDDDDLRRGVPTNHKVFGEALAILTGDAMTTLAFELLAIEYAAAPAPAVALVRELAQAAGPVGMIGGQALDIEAEGKSLSLEQLKNVHRRKTGALLTACCRMGGIASSADDAKLDAITTYGQHLGLAFQIADDLLDITASPEAMGKATGKDSAHGKNTYPALLGVDAARSAAAAEADAALAALTPFGPEADGLRALVRFSIERSS